MATERMQTGVDLSWVANGEQKDQVLPITELDLYRKGFVSIYRPHMSKVDLFVTV